VTCDLPLTVTTNALNKLSPVPVIRNIQVDLGTPIHRFRVGNLSHLSNTRGTVKRKTVRMRMKKRRKRRKPFSPETPSSHLD
jgi:hypothetical protein